MNIVHRIPGDKEVGEGRIDGVFEALSQWEGREKWANTNIKWGREMLALKINP